MTWVHWVLYDLPRRLRLSEGVVAPALHALDGLNDWNRTVRRTLSPIGRHRYFFKLFASILAWATCTVRRVPNSNGLSLGICWQRPGLSVSTQRDDLIQVTARSDLMSF